VTTLTFMANYFWTMFMFEPFKTAWPPGVQQLLTLHLAGWQGGLINCVALVLSMDFFVWPQAARASQRQMTLQPTLSGAQPGER
jgi:hypothetical protein